MALNSLNINNRNTNRMEKSMNRLSSGLRVTAAADDAAGIAISEKMRGQVRGLVMASKNSQDANSFMQVREGALDETHHMMQRMRELTIQSLNDSNTAADRMQLQAELRQLQLGMSDIFDRTEFNTLPAFDPHAAEFNEMQGNRFLNDIVKVSGFHNDLEVIIDGESYKIEINSGHYSREELIDIIDTKLMEVNPNIIMNLELDNSLSLQAEGSSEIDAIRGGLSFLFYEYKIGNPPGMLIGVTEFLDGGKLKIQSGSNDTLIFHVGSKGESKIKLSHGSYDIDELIDVINDKLAAAGETDVRALKYGGKHIALESDRYVITGLSGNMIKIDGITSVLYDNAKYGSVSRTQGTLSGSKNLLSTNTIITEDVNDMLRISVDGGVYRSIKIPAGNYSGGNLVSTINNLLNSNNIGAEAQLYSGGYLYFKSNSYGSNSKVTLDTSYAEPNIYKDLMVSVRTVTSTPDIVDGGHVNATIYGERVIESTTTISDKNDRLSLTIDGATINITLGHGDYDHASLAQEIKSKIDGIIADTGIIVEVKNVVAGIGSLYISKEEGSLLIETNTNGHEELFQKSTLTNIAKNTAGTTTEKPHEEGIVAPPDLTETAAVMTAIKRLPNSVIFGDDNDTLTIKKNGQEYSVVFANKAYTRAQLTAEINKQFASKDAGITASIDSYDRLVFTSVEVGKDEKFEGISGSATVLLTEGLSISKGRTSSTAVDNNYRITGGGALSFSGGLIIDNSNNKLNLTYKHEGQDYEIKLEIEEKTYANQASFLEEVNKKIKAKLDEYKKQVENPDYDPDYVPLDPTDPNYDPDYVPEPEFFEVNRFTGDEVRASFSSDKFVLSVRDEGSDYGLELEVNKLYNQLFVRTDTYYSGASAYNGKQETADSRETYIVGRMDLDEDIMVHAMVNDKLTFDFYDGSSSNKKTFEIVFPAATYSPNELITEMKNQIQTQAQDMGINSGTFKIQIGGVTTGTAISDVDKLVIKFEPKLASNQDNSGTYIIDGVRGNAAYGIFYRAEGEPTPTHMVGATDLSQGAKIVEDKNDELSFYINDELKQIKIPPGDYNAEELLEVIRNELRAGNMGLEASYHLGGLKLAFEEPGMNTIDGFGGNARGTLIFNESSREKDEVEKYQTGANSGQTLDFDKVRLSIELLRINTINISSRDMANKALNRIDSAIERVSSERGRIGATMNRLEATIRSNDNNSENLMAAESRIRDLDMAKEAAELTKTKILQQATIAMMSQANNKPYEVMRLLQG